MRPDLQQRAERIMTRAQNAADMSVEAFLKQQRQQLARLLRQLETSPEKEEELAAFLDAHELRYEVIRWNALITKDPAQVACIDTELLRKSAFVRELYQSSDAVTIAVCNGLTKRQAVAAVRACPWLIHRLENLELSLDINVVYSAVVGDPARGIWHVATMCEDSIGQNVGFMRRAVHANPKVWDELTAHMQHSSILSHTRLKPDVLFAYATALTTSIPERWGEIEWQHLALTDNAAVARWALLNAPPDCLDLESRQRLSACTARLVYSGSRGPAGRSRVRPAVVGWESAAREARLRKLTDIVALYSSG